MTASMPTLAGMTCPDRQHQGQIPNLLNGKQARHPQFEGFTQGGRGEGEQGEDDLGEAWLARAPL